MSLKGKKLVEQFYKLFSNDPEEALKLMHADMSLDWHSSTGYRQLNKTTMRELLTEMTTTYEALRLEIKETIKEDQKVVIYYTYHVRTIENPEEELPLAHFMTIWHLKDNLLYQGSQISQLPNE
ncbi:nuclear transport factor 2 family protein [Zunongwangia sp. HRR-M8]|uniref:nuclear transport factor 2 family protein n=1 Tax=Zunongwangia sp. HRR-M8 TaxID=3015170 RepID=UPI0022DCEDDC|nr:nuclear transport factor 2 family protein [Zunongwangia sp. HRR-M8]WBL23691.1 nuclear transport factor 2 family protein [Zunongwangia sp. HRR-M8]